MSNSPENPSKDFLNLDPRTRRLITIWIIVIATLKLVVINIYLLFCPNALLINSIELKILLSTDSVLIGAILTRVVRYYFPTLKNSQ